MIKIFVANIINKITHLIKPVMKFSEEVSGERKIGIAGKKEKRKRERVRERER